MPDGIDKTESKAESPPMGEFNVIRKKKTWK